METRFASLDRQTISVGDYWEPSCRDRVCELMEDGSIIARGAGVSYVAASFGERIRSIGMRRLDRMLSFEPERKRLTVEAGMSLGALYNCLLPHRFYLPVQPGHPQISIGACVACNVHGKNPQRDGMFADYVESVQLFHPAHGILTLSRQEHADLFDLTCGGFGLTGIILAVTVRLAELPAAAVEVRKVPVRNLEDACEQLDTLKSQYDFLYTWNDLGRFDAHMGRGYLVAARFANGAPTTGAPLAPYHPLDPTRAVTRWRPKVLHRQVVPWMNRIHFAMEMLRPVQVVPLTEIMYPGVSGYYYFDLHGRSGFLAQMVLIPYDRWGVYIRELERLLRMHREPVLVASMKVFAGQQRLLHFNGTGFSIHTHVPNTAGGRALVAAMEDLSHEFRTIRTIYFDSQLTAAAARALYPEFDEFKERLHRFDPKRLFASALSRRLDL